MKDRQFLVLLALVVAAGLVMGLIAFRVSGGSATASAGAPAANATAAKSTRPAASEEADLPPQSEAPIDTAEDDSGEPRSPKGDVPEMKPPSSGDAPGTAAVEPGASGTTATMSGDGVQ